MNGSRNTLAEFMEDAKLLIENALADAGIAAALAGYGYDAAKLAEGRRLWAETDALGKKQNSDTAGKRGAVQDFGKSWMIANSTYMKTLKVARIAFGENARAIAALKLYGPRKESLAGWLDQAGTFYANLAADASLGKTLARFGYDRAKLDAEAALVATVRDKGQAKAQGNGTAQSATVARDAKLRELDAWVSDLRAICRVAFYENPQELEKLGVKVRNGSRKAAAKATSATVAGVAAAASAAGQAMGTATL
ncbi:MAG: hypothetical protein M0001_02990 [Treponema sp.]|nr:hypothetical protein [Treponema sp.]